jgi:hypothetical protein
VAASLTEGDARRSRAPPPATPNPARGQATLRFTLPEAQLVRLAAYDALGHEVVRLVDGAVEAGAHEARLDGSLFPAGVYVARLRAGGEAFTQRVTLVR